MTNSDIHRSSRSQMFFKIGVLRNFAKLTGKHLCQGLFFNKVVGLRPSTGADQGDCPTPPPSLPPKI